MRYILSLVITLSVTFLVGEASAALDVYVYPSKGQTKDQQEQDEFACYKWGKEQTGFDPTQTVQNAAPPTSEDKWSAERPEVPRWARSAVLLQGMREKAQQSALLSAVAQAR